MSLSKVLENIKRVKPLADENVEDGPVETLNGRRGRKSRAIEELKDLKFQYSESLRKTACFIVVVGEKREEFSHIATEQFKCFSVNPDEIYQDISDRVTKTVNVVRTSLNDTFDIMGRHLEDKARELGIQSYPQLIFRQEYRTTIKDNADFTAIVKRAINDQVGAELVGLQAVKSLTDPAIELGHKSQFTPILLLTDDENFTQTVLQDLKRLTPRVYLVVAGKSSKILKAVKGGQSVKDPTPENVEQVLTTIADSLKIGVTHE